MWTSEAVQIRGGKVIVDFGPLRMVILAEAQGKPHLKAALRGAEEAVRLLHQVAECWRRLKRPAVEVSLEREDFPPVVRLMVEACQATGDGTLTPMAAVAGAISDLTADVVQREGAEKVVVENRGDIAVRFSEGFEGSARIGVKTSLEERKPSFLIEVKPESGIRGVATSGLGGMGLTKGIADAAVAASPGGALADACSTLLGNASFSSEAPVERRPAEELDPLTDIGGQLVTFRVGPLSLRHIAAAIEGGARKLEELMASRLALGGLIAVRGFYHVAPEGLAKPLNGSLTRLNPRRDR